MKRFTSIEKLDTGILYCLELASSISILLRCQRCRNDHQNLPLSRRR